MSKHTPGPWRVIKIPGQRTQINWWIEAESKEFPEGHKLRWNPISVCCFSSPNKANARLIAAAPEMLEALKRVKPPGHRSGDCYSDDYIGKCVCGLEIIEAAIAKAEGK